MIMLTSVNLTRAQGVSHVIISLLYYTFNHFSKLKKTTHIIMRVGCYKWGDP